MNKISVIHFEEYQEWYKKERPSLYSRYGKSILAIDNVSHSVVKSFKVTEFRESLSFCQEHHYIHQFCDSVYYAETEVLI